MTPAHDLELLAPAGDWTSLKAAVANGANAVYFGLSNFSARARATNFTTEELPEVMKYLHRHNVKGFVAFNTLIFPDELSSAEIMIRAMAKHGVDAVIVQDLGIVRLIRTIAPSLSIHGSTQMTLTEPRGIEFVRNLGVERVVLARELSLADIQRVTQATTTPVEVFVHGALCVSYSGQCLTSEALGGRSANRGQCAQACRLPYELIVDGQQRELGDKAYLLSPQDLAAYDHIESLIDAGVISFKIEGRLKGGPYVAATTQTYRKAIDTAVAKKSFKLSRREELDLAQTFSRGFVPGFLKGINHQELVRGRVPKSRGIKVGVVQSVNRTGITVRFTEMVPNLLNPGDGVLFDLGKPSENEPGGRIWSVRSHDSRTVAIAFEPGGFDTASVPVGCTVWKTDDPILRKRLEQTYSQDPIIHRIPIRVAVSGCVGGTLEMVWQTPAGLSTSVSWPGPLALATKHPCTTEHLRDALGRLGETPFELGELVNDLPDGLMVPKSVLNDLRRQATVPLLEQHLAGKAHAIVERRGLISLRAESLPPTAEPITDSALTVLVRTLDQLEAVLEHRPTMVYADFEDVRRYTEAVTMARAAGVPIGLAPLRVWKPGEDGLQAVIAKAEPDAILVRNLASIAYYREQLPNATLIGDFSLNVANDLTARTLRAAGLLRLTPSCDLNWEQFASLLTHAPAVWFEPIVHQHMPMFHNEHCVFAHTLSDGKDHRDCGRPCDDHKIELRDRTGASFPVVADAGCRNTVFNSIAQSAAEYIGRMRDLGVRRFRIDLLRESPDQVKPLFTRYTRVINGTDDGRQTWKHLQALNQLGVTRGTLQMA